MFLPRSWKKFLLGQSPVRGGDPNSALVMCTQIFKAILYQLSQALRVLAGRVLEKVLCFFPPWSSQDTKPMKGQVARGSSIRVSFYLSLTHLLCFPENFILQKRKFLQDQSGNDYVNSIIYLFNKCSWHVYHVPAVVPETEDVNKTEKLLTLTELMLQWGGETISKRKINEQDNFQ